jgi:hypothetical protein
MVFIRVVWSNDDRRIRGLPQFENNICGGLYVNFVCFVCLAVASDLKIGKAHKSGSDYLSTQKGYVAFYVAT